VIFKDGFMGRMSFELCLERKYIFFCKMGKLLNMSNYYFQYPGKKEHLELRFEKNKFQGYF
jgi:hypothetical protein